VFFGPGNPDALADLLRKANYFAWGLLGVVIAGQLLGAYLEWRKGRRKF
jgi:hypothetical protein